MAKMAATSSIWLPISPMANVPDTAIALTGDAIGHHTDPDFFCFRSPCSVSGVPRTRIPAL